MAYLYDLTDTWNAAGTVFNAIKMNVTNTASAAGSKIVSLQVGATDRFTVDKDGNGYFSGTLQAVGSITAPNVYIGANSGTIGMQDNSASILAYNGTGSGGITNTLRFITGAAERVRIDGSGNVGIGTSSPAVYTANSRLLQIDGGANAAEFKLTNSTTGSTGADGTLMQLNGSAFYLWNLENSFISFGTNNAERMRIDSSGNVGIGTSSPSVKLDVSGGHIRMDDGYKLRWGDGTAAWEGSGASDVLIGYTNNTERMRIDSSGNLGIGTTSPGYRLTVYNNINGTPVSWGNAARSGFLYQDASGVGVTDGANTAFTNGLYLGTASNYVALYTSANERMRIDSSGNVGIGTTAPSNQLSVAGNNTATISLDWTGDNAAKAWFSANHSTGEVRHAAVTNYFPTFYSNNNERMRIDLSGNVGIGTSSPGAKLHVLGSEVRLQNTGGFYSFYDTAGTTRVGYIQNATGNIAIVNEQAGYVNFYTSNTERMRLDSSGRLLIGTTTAIGALTVESSTATAAVLRNPSASGYTSLRLYNDQNSGSRALEIDYFGSTASGGERAEIATTGAYPLLFLTNNTERARINSSGDLLVGQSAGGFSNGNSMTLEPSAGYCVFNHINGTASGTKYHYFAYNGGEIGSITQNGTTAVAYNTTSDYRLKDINGPVQNSGAYIDALKPVQGSWKADGSRFIGLIAHEVQEVSETQIATGVKDGEEMQAMDYSAPELIANLIAEIQSLRARVAQLEGN